MSLETSIACSSTARTSIAATSVTGAAPVEPDLRPRTLTVCSVRTLADGVVELELSAAEALPTWTAGAHLEIETPVGPRQYSLCGPREASTWRVAILEEPEGRGGSSWAHRLGVGDELVTVGPRNHFEMAPTGDLVLLAGGIGITPIMAMIEEAEAAGRTWRLYYGGRSRTSMAYADDLAARYGDRVQITPQDTHGLLDVASIVAGLGAAVVHACGPTPMLDALEAEMGRRGCGDRLRTERFTPREVDTTGDEAFEVELSWSGGTVAVPADRSLLDVLVEAGVDVLSSCAEGTCGTCETPVLEGEVDHRDSILTASERERHDVIYVCCSRAARGCPRLVLDL